MFCCCSCCLVMQVPIALLLDCTELNEKLLKSRYFIFVKIVVAHAFAKSVLFFLFVL